MSLIDQIVDEVFVKRYSLRDIEKKFNIPVRKVSYLIRKDLITPIVDNGKIFISEDEVKRYLSLPKVERKKHHKSFLKTLGPGIITGASDDDPSGIATYSTVGSQFGLSLSWLAVYLLPFMISVQETCGRIGIVTKKGLAREIERKAGKKVLIFLLFMLLLANTINVAANLGAMSASLRMISGINFYVGILLISLLILFLLIRFSYHQYVKILKWLTFSLFAYIITGVLIRPDWLEVAKSIASPQIKFNYAYFAALVAVMGTTISPYLFFWQTSEEVEEKKDAELNEEEKLTIRAEIEDMRKDTIMGMSFSNLVFLFIVITTAFVLHKNGITDIETSQQAAEALRPLAGDLSYLLFAVGIIGTGLLSIPVLVGSSAYAVSELFRWREGLSEKFSKAKGFYGIMVGSLIIGLAINLLGINPIKALYYAAIINGLVAPILLYFIFSIGRDKKIMGEFTNPRIVNVLGWITTILMGTAAIILIIFTVNGFI